MGPRLADVSTSRTLPPALETAIPGPRSRALAERLARVESRNVTCLVPDAPIFWERAAGANVWDVDGNRFVDLGAGFGVANAGHAHPRILAALREQDERLLHGMGDVHPSAVKVELLERLRGALSRRRPGAQRARLFGVGRRRDRAEDGAARHGPRGGRRVRGRLSRPHARRARRHAPARVPRAVRRATARRHRLRSLRRLRGREPTRRRVADPDRRRAGRADPGPRRRAYPAGRVPHRAARDLRPRRLAADRRRGLHRIRTHRPLVRVRPRGRRAGSALRGQGTRLRHADFRVHRSRRRDGRVAGFGRRGAPHPDLPRPSARLRCRAGVDRGARGREAGAALRRTGRGGARAAPRSSVGTARNPRRARSRPVARPSNATRPSAACAPARRRCGAV